MLKLIYKEKEYYAKTWAAFTDEFPELETWTHPVYNNRRNYKCDTFEVSVLSIMERQKAIENDKRIRNKKSGKRGGLWERGSQLNN